jgi:hypothetical protein
MHVHIYSKSRVSMLAETEVPVTSTRAGIIRITYIGGKCQKCYHVSLQIFTPLASSSSNFEKHVKPIPRDTNVGLFGMMRDMEYIRRSTYICLVPVIWG